MDRTRYNKDGYRDDTAFSAINGAMRKKHQKITHTGRDADADEVIWIIKRILDRYDFQLVDRIHLKDQKSGKLFM